MQGKRKVRTAAENIALHLPTSNLDLAIQTGDLFFPQSTIPQPTAQRVSVNLTTISARLSQSLTPWTNYSLWPSYLLHSRILSLEAILVPMASPMLRSLTSGRSHKDSFLGRINVIWEVGEFRKEWLESIVIPYPHLKNHTLS